MIKAIIFDLWETLGTKNIGISKTLRNKFNIEKTPDFLIKYEHAIQLKKFSSQDELSKSFLNHFDIELLKENIDFVVNTLNQGITKATLFDGMYELMEKLSKDYKLGMLSNTTFFESQVPENLKINHFFEAQVFSWQIGSIKPSFKAFEAICSKLNVTPGEAIFVDDGEKNVLAAKEFGLKVIQFRNIEQLKEELKKYLVDF